MQCLSLMEIVLYYTIPLYIITIVIHVTYFSQMALHPLHRLVGDEPDHAHQLLAADSRVYLALCIRSNIEIVGVEPDPDHGHAAKLLARVKHPCLLALAVPGIVGTDALART